MKKRMKIALYEIKTNVDRYQYLEKVEDYRENETSSYVRISNVVEIEFDMVPDSQIIPVKIEALRAEKGKMTAKFDEEIGKLLAITHQPEEDDAELDKPEYPEPLTDGPAEPIEEGAGG